MVQLGGLFHHLLVAVGEEAVEHRHVGREGVNDPHVVLTPFVKPLLEGLGREIVPAPGGSGEDDDDVLLDISLSKSLVNR